MACRGENNTQSLVIFAYGTANVAVISITSDNCLLIISKYFRPTNTKRKLHRLGRVTGKQGMLAPKKNS